MLIDFSIENFKSFREKQTFSMEAAPYLQTKSNVISIKIHGQKKPLKLLRAAAIYGPNASGKSNLVDALHILNTFVNNDLGASSGSLPVSCFRFDPELVNKPSRFEISFISEGKIYKYELSATSERIHHEALYDASSGKALPIYIRTLNNGSEEYAFPALDADETLRNAWVNLTNPRQTFIGQAAINSKESLLQLKIPSNWLQTNLRKVPKDLSNFISLLQLMHNEAPNLEMSNQLALFLSELDIPISEVDFNSTSLPPASTVYDALLEDNVTEEEKNKKIRAMFNKSKVTLKHQTSLGEASFSFNEESEGTKNLAGFHLLWTMLINNTAFKSVAFDELDSSLHPKILEKLIKQFIAKECTAQLIFTTHNTHLMDSKLLRRDQFWITERDNNGATRLNSIYDYEGRESEDVEKRYFEGRYRGLPNINND